MSKSSPENLEERYQLVQRLANKSNDTRLFFMAMSGAGLAGFFINLAYVDQKYFPLTNTLEEVQQGVMNPFTEAALTASMGPVAFMVFTIASVIAYSLYSYQTFRYDRQTRNLLKEMENQAKRPPTLGS